MADTTLNILQQIETVIQQQKKKDEELRKKEEELKKKEDELNKGKRLSMTLMIRLIRGKGRS